MHSALQALLPQHALGRLARALARCRIGWLKNGLIRAFVRHYRPRMQEAAEPDPLRYESFNALFTRALRQDSRPLDPDPHSVVSPCDGAIAMAGALDGTQLLQAKGLRYTLESLLDGEAPWVERLRGGLYATIYLAPFDYHRVHMPLEGTLRAARRVPGRLFSVNAATAASVPGLFTRNERVLCLFEGPHGPFALVLVGALLVGGICTVWHGEVRAAGALAARPGTLLRLARGQELGRFEMGSTVILLLPRGAAGWDPGLLPGHSVRFGARIGSLAS